MAWHYLEKEFYDYADDVEAVSIHYVCAPHSSAPDWENQCVTRYMPVAKAVLQVDVQTGALSPAGDPSASPTRRLRKKVLKLPSHISSPKTGALITNGYLLHYYFEICQDGSRHYSPLYTEEIVTSTRAPEESPPQDSDVPAPAR